MNKSKSNINFQYYIFFGIIGFLIVIFFFIINSFISVFNRTTLRSDYNLLVILVNLLLILSLLGILKLVELSKITYNYFLPKTKKIVGKIEEIDILKRPEEPDILKTVKDIQSELENETNSSGNSLD